jgi:phosphinothricin acetyltransferase
VPGRPTRGHNPRRRPARVPAPTVRPARPSDLDGINRIYDHYVRTSTSTFDLEPPPAAERAAWFGVHAGGRYRLWVAAADGGAVHGFACSSPYRPRLAYQTTVEVSIYVAPESLGHGLGDALYRALFDSLRDEELHRAVAVIALPNPASVTLHTRWGFREVGCFHEVGLKFGRYWDVSFWERPMERGVPVARESKR